MKNIFKKIWHTIESTYLCIRYPFLYPRNRFTDKHYNNWTLENYLYGYVPQGKWNEETRKVETPPRVPGLQDKAWHHEVFFIDNPKPEEERMRIIHYRKSLFYAIWFYIVKGFYNFIIRPLHAIPTHTEWDAVEPGWKKAFGNQYLKDLKRQLKKDKCLYSWRIMQIKEKYGTFRLYCNFGSDELYNLIQKYEDLSYKTCIKCGRPATKLSSGWISPYCDECFDKEGLNDPMCIMNNGKWKETDEYLKLLVEMDKEYAKTIKATKVKKSKTSKKAVKKAKEEVKEANVVKKSKKTKAKTAKKESKEKTAKKAEKKNKSTKKDANI